jgi:hypothetical protein
MLTQEILQDIYAMMSGLTYENIAKKHKVANWEMQRAIAFALGVAHARDETFDNKYQKTLNFYKKILGSEILTTTKKERDFAINNHPELMLNHDNLQAFNSFKLGFEYELKKRAK